MRPCQVEIFGQTYALRSDADEEHIRKVAALVDAKMREVAAGTRSVSTVHIAVLAALDLASECLQQRGEVQRVTSAVEARSNELAQRLADLLPET